MLLLSHFLLLSFQWSPSWWETEKKRQIAHNEHFLLNFQTQTRTKICVKSERGLWGRWSVGSRAVWSRQGQTVARHPEELPLCPCTATGCNLLLRDKTKLTRPFTGDPAASLGQQHAPAPTGHTSEPAPVYKIDWWSLSIMVILNLRCTLTETLLTPF